MYVWPELFPDVVLTSVVDKLVVISAPHAEPLKVRALNRPRWSACSIVIMSLLGEGMSSLPTIVLPEVVVSAAHELRPPDCVHEVQSGCWVLELDDALKIASGVPESAFSHAVLMFWPASWAMVSVV